MPSGVNSPWSKAGLDDVDKAGLLHKGNGRHLHEFARKPRGLLLCVRGKVGDLKKEKGMSDAAKIYSLKGVSCPSVRRRPLYQAAGVQLRARNVDRTLNLKGETREMDRYQGTRVRGDRERVPP